MSWIAAGALAVTVIASVSQRNDQKKQEKAAKRREEEGKGASLEAGRFQAVQLERKAGEERAIGSIEASEQAREGEFIKSRAKAIGAASGAGGYEDTLTDIDAEKEYRTLTALFNSEQSARDLEVGAEVARREGADAARAYEGSSSIVKARNKATNINNATNILNSGASLYQQFGRT